MKYTILEDNKKRLPDGNFVYRIQAVRDFGNIKAGTLGGYVADGENLSHRGNCWIADKAIASGFSCVNGDAVLSGNAQLSGFAWIAGNAVLTDNATMTDYTSAYRNHCNNTVHITQSVSKFHNELRKTLTECGFGFREYQQKRTGNLTAYADNIWARTRCAFTVGKRGRDISSLDLATSPTFGKSKKSRRNQ